uniref:LRRNT domain-containing protein n=1 Tax=Macrostomum lignano TaxID=282301 RepID=A0A1I8JQQ5_9PLAT
LITAASFVTGSLTACGYCMCERPRQCPAISAQSTIESSQASICRISYRMRTVSNGSALTRPTLRICSVNCKNRPSSGHAEPVFPAQVDHHRSVRPNQNRAGRIRGTLHSGKFDASDNNLELLPPALFGQRTLSILKLSENPRLRLIRGYPSCPPAKSPFSLMDIELTKVEPSKFLCPPPRISGG